MSGYTPPSGKTRLYIHFPSGFSGEVLIKAQLLERPTPASDARMSTKSHGNAAGEMREGYRTVSKVRKRASEEEGKKWSGEEVQTRAG